MEEIRLNSWDEFIELVNKFDIVPDVYPLYTFRGQANKDWELQPTLLRHLLRLGVNHEDAITLERIALDEFLSQIHLHLPPGVPFPETYDLFGGWSLMQHYGSPTRLLDWTGSIYIAAYFAVIEEFNSDGAIWIVRRLAVPVKMRETFQYDGLSTFYKSQKNFFTDKEADHIIEFTNRTFRTDRMIAQQGLYSLCLNPLLDHGQILSDTFESDDEHLVFEKRIIPAELKTLFMRKLRLMNITAGTLFPGLDGIGKSISELITLGVTL